MKNPIDKFYVLDFDRCLGDLNSCFRLLQEIVSDLSDIDVGALQDACNEAIASGESFDAFDFLKQHDGGLDLAKVEKTYLERAKLKPGCLLKPGANNLTDYIQSSNHRLCIMSYGYPQWQILKITASGLGEFPCLIVTDKHKGRIIARWLNRNDNQFNIPKECFNDQQPRTALEIVLVDDKLSAFNDLPSGSRGYLVLSEVTFDTSMTHEGTIPLCVKQVSSLNEIIDLETSLKE